MHDIARARACGEIREAHLDQKLEHLCFAEIQLYFYERNHCGLNQTDTQSLSLYQNRPIDSKNSCQLLQQDLELKVELMTKESLMCYEEDKQSSLLHS